MRIVITLLVLALLPAPTAAQSLVCGGHLIRGGGEPVLLDAPVDVQLGRQRRSGWMSARDRELWNQLIYNAYDNHSTNAGPLDRRQTLVVDADRVPTITVCIESADQSYTGERMAPFANERWWREHIDHWTGIAWRGDLQIGRECSSALFRKIEVREGDPEELGNSLAVANSSRGGTRWLRTEILFHPEHLQKTSEWQAGWALAHELGHALGTWHVEQGTGFVMEARNPRNPRQMPEKERELAQLAYEVGPGVRYPGLVDTTPVPALPLVGLLLLGGVLVGRGVRMG